MVLGLFFCFNFVFSLPIPVVVPVLANYNFIDLTRERDLVLLVKSSDIQGVLQNWSHFVRVNFIALYVKL